ncbi:hypothetical protein JOQ06_016613 [Pogonophryne albipinna]|uniref:Uncharacterized protein n=1 Tax=Pogonophryne albipinna TaxID=1090488 RepID=A0AAD6ACA0_9TELE|nr:hypothetical protein JOQ06_016613 [Pogonophryne albipinna]
MRDRVTRGETGERQVVEERQVRRETERHQQGLVLRGQVIEVRVTELEYISARGPQRGNTRQQREREEAGTSLHHGENREEKISDETPEKQTVRHTGE